MQSIINIRLLFYGIGQGVASRQAFRFLNMKLAVGLAHLIYKPPIGHSEYLVSWALEESDSWTLYEMRGQTLSMRDMRTSRIAATSQMLTSL